MATDYRDFPILYVDDERENLLTFRYALEDRFTVLTAGSGRDALGLLERERLSVLVCDQRMPEMTGVEVCAAARAVRPEVARIIVTAYADLQAAVDAINKGEVLRYIAKPWRDKELRATLESCIDLVELERTVRDMQVRLFRGGSSRVAEQFGADVARQLEAPVAALEMSAEQVGDLLDTGLATWAERERAEQLVRHARDAHRESAAPIGELKAMGDRLRRRQRLDTPPRAHATDVTRVVRATVRMLEEAVIPPLRVRVVLEGSPVAPIEPARLGQILVHLVMNATQAMEALPREAAAIEILVGETPEQAIVRVSDTGPGIASELRERVFDPFFTTHSGRQGTGLSLARQLAEDAGGSLEVHPMGRQGACFLLRLPRVATAR